MADQVMTLREGGRGRRAQDWPEELRHPRGLRGTEEDTCQYFIEPLGA